MTLQQDRTTPTEVRTGGADRPVQSPPHPVPPNLSGDVHVLLESGPAFHSALRGYDRLQVDNYVAWAEQEMLASRRAITELVQRLGEREAELQRARQVSGQSPRSRELTAVSDRVAEMLRLAAAEADAARAAGAVEAADIVAQAHVEADLIKRRAQHLEAQAAARLQQAERLRTEAIASMDRSRVEAEKVLQQAAAERDRLDAQAAQARARDAAAAARKLAAEEEQVRRTCAAAEATAAERVAEAAQQLEMLLRQQDGVRQFLRLMSDQVDSALQLLTDDPAREFSFAANLTVKSTGEHAALPQAVPPGPSPTVSAPPRGRRPVATAVHGPAHRELSSATGA